jgi:hypothetical protein
VHPDAATTAYGDVAEKKSAEGSAIRNVIAAVATKRHRRTSRSVRLPANDEPRAEDARRR